MTGTTVGRRLSGCATLVIGLTSLGAAGCLLDRSPLEPSDCPSPCSTGQACVGGECVPRPDGGPFDAGMDDAGGDGGLDAGPDGGTDSGTDAGPPHCRDGVVNMGETDADCGGPCAPCDGCLRCAAASDCASGACDVITSRCAPATESVTEGGTTFDAFRRADGRILIAHYAPGAYNLGYSPSSPQTLSTTGGALADASFAPTPCGASGHMAFTRFNPAGRAVTIECGADYSAPAASYRASNLFTSFAGATYGDTSGVAAGDHPGWAAIGAVSLSEGRSGAGMCGQQTGSRVGGIGYCSGPADPTPALIWDNHLVSLSIDPVNAMNSYVACGGQECRLGLGTSVDCPHVWVWIDP